MGLAAINFSVFRRTDSCKVILYCDSLRLRLSRIVSLSVDLDRVRTEEIIIVLIIV